MPSLATLDGRNEGRSAEARDVHNALQAVHAFGVELHCDQAMQRFLQQCKRLYQLALQVAVLGGLRGDTADLRNNIGTVERQNRKIHGWPASQALDPTRMINILRASLKRTEHQDRKRAGRKKKAPSMHCKVCRRILRDTAKHPMHDKARKIFFPQRRTNNLHGMGAGLCFKAA